MAKTTLIGGFHAVLAALEDAHDKPFEVLLADTRHDERIRNIQQLAQGAGVRVRVEVLAAPEAFDALKARYLARWLAAGAASSPLGESPLPHAAETSSAVSGIRSR